jgi:hypothetical protein
VTNVAFEVQVDQKQVDEALSLFKFIGGNASDAIRVAINKSGPPIRTESSKQIRSQVRLSASYINERDGSGRQRLSFTKATKSNLTGAIRTQSRGLLLSRFSTNPQISKATFVGQPPIPARGIKVKVKPSSGTKTMGREWFYMRLKNSNAIGIARKRPKGQTGPKGGKYEVAYGPSLSQVFNDVRNDVLPKAAERYQEELGKAIAFLLRKRFPKE